MLQKSAHGRELLATAEETGGVTLCPTKKPEEVPGIAEDKSGKTLAIIYMNPRSPNGIPRGCKDPHNGLPPRNRKGCAVVLGHELGHLRGEDDEGRPGEGGRNVELNENPVRRDLGLPCRRTYEGNPVGGSLQ